MQVEENFLWEYLEGETPTFFSRESIVKIEKAYASQETTLELAPKIVIDFTNMVISKNGHTSPIGRIVFDSSISAMLNKEGLWQYMGDNGQCVNYRSDVDKILEAAYKAEQTRRGIFINNRLYIIDFMKMVQHNPISGFSRKIRRNNTSELGKLNAIWVWLDDMDLYLPYAIKEMLMLENMYEKKTKRSCFKSEYGEYTIDLSKMTQCNKQTQRYRNIRRIPLSLLADPIVWQYEEKDEFKAYDAIESELIEKAYQSNKERYNGKTHNLNFKIMKWTNTKTKETGNVRRVDKVDPSASQYLWQYLSAEGYVSYNLQLNKSIEDAYLSGKPSLSFAERGILYTLHFGTMEQEDVKRQYYRAVRRITEEAKKWEHYKALAAAQPSQPNYSLTKLDNRSTEYEIVKTYFDKTMREKYKTMDVIKVNNPFSKSFYNQQIEQYEKVYKKQPLVLLLFYGNKNCSPLKICDSSNESFDIKYSMSEDKWGKGIYFCTSAANICNGNEYKEEDKNYIIFAKVIVGEPQNIIDNPKRPDINSIKVESTNSDIYIITERNMAYPKYLIEYTAS